MEGWPAVMKRLRASRDRDAQGPEAPLPLRVLWVTALVLLSAWTVSVLRTADQPVIGAVLGLAAGASLTIQRRAPVVALVAAFGALVLASRLPGFEGPDDPFIVLILWASFGVGRYASLRQQPWAAAGTLFFLSMNLLTDDQPALPAELVFPVLFTAIPWLLGLAVQLARGREQRAEWLAHGVIESHEQLVREATQEERIRLARELHDVAAHSMSVVSLQAQVLRRRLESGSLVGPEDARVLETTAQQALQELRRVVGVLRLPDEEPALAPQPQADQIEELVAVCRKAGQPIALVVGGLPPPMPRGVSLSAYRIVQEALSNARRHGRTGDAQVDLHWEDTGVRLRIANAISMIPAATVGDGHGLSGMRERVQLHGGTFAAGPDDSGRWVVDVWLPTSLLSCPDR